MQNKLKLLLAIALFVVSSCSFANKSTVTVPINSNPSGANIVIDGKNFGQTPAFVELTPNKNYKATLSKDGYGSTNIDMETWYSLRSGSGADGSRCMADVGAFVLPYFIVLMFAPEKCGSFKKSDYFVDFSSGMISGQNPNMSASNQNQVNNVQMINNNSSQYQTNSYQNPQGSLQQGSQYRTQSTY